MSKLPKGAVFLSVVVATIGLGAVCLFEYFRPGNQEPGKTLFLIAATALLPAGVLWAIEHSLLLQPAIEEAKAMLDQVRTRIDDTETLASFKNHGLYRASSDREHLVREVLEHAAHDSTVKEIVIVGSTLDGLTRRAPWFRQFIEDAKTNRKHLKLIFTHWDFVSHREKQEDRARGTIAQELLDSVSKIRSWGVPPDSIRLAYGAPTVFMVIAGMDMILNPYPFGAESVTSLTIWLKNQSPGKPEGAMGSVWHQYYTSHYQMAWDPAEPQHADGDGRRISCALPADWREQIEQLVESIRQPDSVQNAR